MKDVDRLGIWETVRLALDKICPGFKRPLHVSFDIDALDDLEVSNTGTPGSLCYYSESFYS
jgi:arginase